MSAQLKPDLERVLDNPKWQTNQIASNASSLYKSLLLFGIFWNGFISVIFFFIWDDLEKTLNESPGLYLFIIFPLAGIFIIYLGVKQALAWNKFGSTPLVMDPFPGQIGGEVSGYINVDIDYDPTKVAVISLSCLRHELVTNGDKSEYDIHTVWNKELTVNLTTSSIGSRINFEFDVPEGLPESELESELFHNWEIQVKLPLKGLDFEREFIIPVLENTD